MDIAAITGDTVHNVLMANTWGVDQMYTIGSVVVDSIVTYTNNDISVTRHYFASPEWGLAFPTSNEMFWQAGIGGSFGPLAIESVVDAFEHVSCLRQQDTYVCSMDFAYPGLPGIPCDCPLDSPLGIENPVTARLVLVSPNPSAGLFTLDARIRSAAIYDAIGIHLFTTNTSRIDLAAYSPGIYHAHVLFENGVSRVQLVVQR